MELIAGYDLAKNVRLTLKEAKRYNLTIISSNTHGIRHYIAFAEPVRESYTYKTKAILYTDETIELDLIMKIFTFANSHTAIGYEIRDWE